MFSGVSSNYLSHRASEQSDNVDENVVGQPVGQHLWPSDVGGKEQPDLHLLARRGQVPVQHLLEQVGALLRPAQPQVCVENPLTSC